MRPLVAADEARRERVKDDEPMPDGVGGELSEKLSTCAFSIELRG
jgi:hypothetical protein